MKLYKQIDFWIQVTVIVISLLLPLFFEIAFFYGYLLTGGVQLLSVIMHELFSTHYYPVRGRKYYFRTLLVVIGIGIFMLPIFIIYGFALLFLSPVMAIWYTSICYTENKLLEQKAFVHLK